LFKIAIQVTNIVLFVRTSHLASIAMQPFWETRIFYS